MSDKSTEAARVRCAHKENMLVIKILGVVVIGLLVGVLLGNDRALPTLGTVIGMLGGYAGGYVHAAHKGDNSR